MRGLVTCDFAVALLCVVERRRCVVLGMERSGPGDAFWRCCLIGLLFFSIVRAIYCSADSVFVCMGACCLFCL